MKHGENFRLTYGTLLVNRMRVPDEWVNPPVLPSHLEWVRDAYIRLSTCRDVLFDIAPIKWIYMHEYAKFMNLNEDEEEWFVLMMERLDDAVVKYIKDSRPKDKEPKNGKK